MVSAVIDQINLEPAQRRIWRSREARAIRDALLHFTERGALSDFTAGKLRLGRMTFTVLCNDGRSYCLRLDIDAGTLRLSGLLPHIDERSPLFKELKNFLRPFATAQVSPSLRMDPNRAEVNLVAEDSGVVLLATVKGSQYEHCARRLVGLADEVRRLFPCELSSHGAERRDAAIRALTLG